MSDVIVFSDVMSCVGLLVVGLIWAFVARISGKGWNKTVLLVYFLPFALFMAVESLNFSVDARDLIKSALFYGATFTAALSLDVMLRSSSLGKFAAVRLLLGIFQILLITFPLAMLVHLLMGGKIGIEELIAIHQASVPEALSYAATQLPFLYALIISVSFLFVMWISYRSCLNRKPSRTLLTLLGLFMLCALPFAKWAVYGGETPKLASVLRNFQDYADGVVQFRALRKSRESAEVLVKATPNETSGVHVVIIGESQNKKHLGAYGYHRNTTPWLSGALSNQNFVKFSNAYSAHTHTVPVLGYALTESSQYNPKPFEQSISVLDVLNAAGYRTVWISNQLEFGEWDGAVSALAFIAKEKSWTDVDSRARLTKEQLDESVIAPFEQAISQTGENRKTVVFVHLYGSHGSFVDRYPRGFSWMGETEFDHKTDGKTKLSEKVAIAVDNYDTSILYTDYVLSTIFELAMQNKVKSVFYFADHSEAVTKELGHDSSKFVYDMARIPIFAWFSDEYVERNREKFDRVSNRKDVFFTNDIVHDTLIGIYGIDTPAYTTQQDLSSENYSLPMEKLATVHGRHKISEDPELLQRKIYTGDKKFWAHRVNTLGKLSDAFFAGVSGIEVDVLFRRDKNMFEIGHDEKVMSGMNLDAFMKSAQRYGIFNIWLDVKNFNDKNAEEALVELERLASEYAWMKHSVVLETQYLGEEMRRARELGWNVSYYLPTDLLLSTKEAQKLRIIAEDIAPKLSSLGIKAVSFDAQCYEFVRDFLSPLMRDDLAMRTWGLDPLKEDIDDPRIEVILIPLLSDFSL